jgi:hypothetical protein
LEREEAGMWPSGDQAIRRTGFRRSGGFLNGEAEDGVEESETQDAFGPGTGVYGRAELS